MDELVRGVLEAHLPAVGRAWRRGDEEELSGVGEGEVVGLGLVYRGRLAKVDLDALAHDGLAVPDLADGESGLDGVEGDDDAAEGLERGEGVDGDGVFNEAADDLDVLGEEDVKVVEVGEEEGVGRRGGVDERRQVGEVEGEVWLAA